MSIALCTSARVMPMLAKLPEEVIIIFRGITSVSNKILSQLRSADFVLTEFGLILLYRADHYVHGMPLGREIELVLE